MQHNAIMKELELLISHSGIWHLIPLWNFNSFCCECSGMLTAACCTQTRSNSLHFGVARGQLTRPSAGAAPSHIWRAWNRLHGTTAWHCLTQQSRHLAGQCERPAPVKQSKPVIRRRHWVWLSDSTSLLHSTCIGLTQNCTGHGQLAPPNTGNTEFCRGVQILNICSHSITEAPGGS